MNDKVAENIEEKEEASSELDHAFVKEEARVLDPKLLNKSLLDRMPTPSGWRILVLPYRGKGVTEGGIQLVWEQTLVSRKRLGVNWQICWFSF